MDTYAIVDNATSKVVNIIIWDGVTSYTPPQGTSAIKANGACIGWEWDGQSFVNPQPE